MSLGGRAFAFSGAPSPTGVTIKNTFIHYEDDDVQPDYRPTKSTPVPRRQAAAFSMDCSEEPAFVQMNTPDVGGGCAWAGAGKAVDAPQAAEAAPPSYSASGEGTSLAESEGFTETSVDETSKAPALELRRPAAAMEHREPSNNSSPIFVPLVAESNQTPATRRAHLLEYPHIPTHGTSPAVKNTFIHFTFDDQPDYVPAKSGPAKLVSAVGGDCSSTALNIAFAGDSPNSVSSASGATPAAADGVASAVAAAAEAPDAHAPAPAAALESDTLPSRGSVGHATGTCKACAHNWKPGGCAKGYDCTFCHACDEDDFKRRRKEKLSRIKAEKVKRRSSEFDGGGSVSETSPVSPADAPIHIAEESGPGILLNGRPLGGAGAAAAIEAVTDPGSELALGEVDVEYTAVGCARINWAVDLRKLKTQNRCGMSRRFNLQLFASEVPFVLFVAPVEPAEASGAGAPRAPRAAAARKAQQAQPLRYATMQLKCTDPTLLAGNCVGVSFAVGGLPARKASDAHDFSIDSCCSLSPKDALWDVSSAGMGSRCMLNVEIWLSVC
mmetsp:Transcript_51822/g.149437  ORF Transcript_51822/g.149437 Transcript_51822/m.149437 type:complete len:554 (-) Transcript_51822:142-1803(-)